MQNEKYSGVRYKVSEKGIAAVTTEKALNTLKDKNAARVQLVEYARENFPKTVINQNTNAEIGISRNGIDKFLSGNISKEKYATGYIIPQIIETAKKVGEADNHKGTHGITGYEYYENNVVIDGDNYKAHIRVRNTDMGDKYYGHTISRVVDEIKIEPLARGSKDKSSGHSVNASGSNKSVTQNNVVVKDGEIYSQGKQVSISDKSDVVNGVVVNGESKRMKETDSKGYGVAEKLATSLKKPVKFVKGLYDADGNMLDGIETDNGIFINTEAKNPIKWAATHEFSHTMKKSAGEAWAKYQNFVVDKMKKDGNYYDVFEAKAKAYGTRDAAYINEEIAADHIGETFDSVDELADFIKKDRGLAVRVRDFYYKALDKLGLVDEKKKAQLMWRDAYRKAVLNVKDGKTESNGKSEPKYKLNPTFEKAFDNWVENLNRRNGIPLKVGSTSEALMSIGVIEQDIRWDTTKINDTLKKHPDIDIRMLKSIPNLIENPVLIMEERNKKASKDHGNNRIFMLGELYNENGLPIIAFLELETQNRDGIYLNEIKIVSTHSRVDETAPESFDNTKNFVKNSHLLYLDPNKNRTNSWLARNRLQLPFLPTTYGPINKITYSEEYVKSNPDKFKLEDRVKGDDLLNALNIVGEIKDIGGTVDDNGIVTLFHATNDTNARAITNNKKVSAKEDGLFFSTKADGEIQGYGKTVLEFKIPVEMLEMNDIFQDEILFRISLKNKNEVMDVSKYLVIPSDVKGEFRKSISGTRASDIEDTTSSDTEGKFIPPGAEPRRDVKVPEAVDIVNGMKDGKAPTAREMGKATEKVITESITRDGGMINVMNWISTIEGRDSSYVGSMEALDTAKAVMRFAQGKATDVDKMLISRSNGATTLLTAIEGNTKAWDNIDRAAGRELRSAGDSSALAPQNDIDGKYKSDEHAIVRDGDVFTKDGKQVAISDKSDVVNGVVVNGESKRMKETDSKGYGVAEKLATSLKKPVKFVKGLYDADGNMLDGIETDNGIFINTEAKNPIKWAATHEFSHTMKKSAGEAWAKYQNFVVDKMKKDGNYYDVFEAKAKAYGTRDVAYINEEIAADHIGETFDSVDELADFIKKDRGLAVKVRDFYYKALDKLGCLDEKKKAQLMWRDAYRKAVLNVKDGKTESKPETKKSASGTRIGQIYDNNTGQFIVENNIVQAFESKVDAWKSGNIKGSDYFELGKTPIILRELGVANLPVAFDLEVMWKMTGGKHGIDIDNIKQLPVAINNPLMILESSSRENAYVFVLPMLDKSGDTSIAAIHLNRHINRLLVNKVTSVYGKENIEGFIKREIEKGKLKYYDKIKSQQWSTSRGLQLPKLVQSITDNNIILQKEDVVNTYSMQNGENNSKKSISGTRASEIEDTTSSDTEGKFIPPGAEPRRDVKVPESVKEGTKVRQFARTAAEAETLTDTTAEGVLENVEEGKFNYTPISNKSAMSNAYASLDTMGEEWVEKKVSGAISTHSLDKSTVAMAEVLMQKYSQEGQNEKAQKLIIDFAAESTRTAQSLQAISMLKKLDPNYEVAYIDKVVENLREEIIERNNKKFGKKPSTDIEVSEELKTKLMEAKTEEEREAIRDEIYTEIADQLPNTWINKWNAWRYMAMLGNARTHVRNVVGNASFMPMIATKNIAAKFVEPIVAKFVDGRRGWTTPQSSMMTAPLTRGAFERITVDMDEDARYEVLKDKKISPVLAKTNNSADIDFEYLEKNIKSVVEKELIKKFQSMGIMKNYTSLAVKDVSFDFTGKGFRKSLHSQETSYGGNKADFAKILLNIQELLDSSVLIETHTDKGKGTVKEKRGLEQVYVLLGTLKEGNSVVPVQFEIEKYLSRDNRLYLAVALTKIETGVKGNTALDKQEATSLLPISNISISEIFAKINPADKNFLKYIPNQFLNDEQIRAKNVALEIEKKKYSGTTQQTSTIPHSAKSTATSTQGNRGEGFERSKTFFVGKKYRQFATEDVEVMRKELQGGGKHNPSDIIRDKQRVFDTKMKAVLKRERLIL